jgi:hypothetical protein
VDRFTLPDERSGSLFFKELQQLFDQKHRPDEGFQETQKLFLGGGAPADVINTCPDEAQSIDRP